MSAISLRPLIQSVTGIAMSAITISADVAAALVLSSLHSLSSSERQALERSVGLEQRGKPTVIEPVSTLRGQYQAHKQHAQAGAQITDLATMKAATLASVAASPYLTEDSKAVQQHLGMICRAKSAKELLRAESAALSELEAGHQQLFVKSLAFACGQAAAKVGFSHIQTTNDAQGAVRVIATDDSGRSLVTEIKADARKESSIATEVVGVFDGSCNKILDAFDEALEAEGVRASVLKRKFTGGVCALEATRSFIQSKVKRSASSEVAAQASSSSRRNQRLNQRLSQKQR